MRCLCIKAHTNEHQYSFEITHSTSINHLPISYSTGINHLPIIYSTGDIGGVLSNTILFADCHSPLIPVRLGCRLWLSIGLRNCLLTWNLSHTCRGKSCAQVLFFDSKAGFPDLESRRTPGPPSPHYDRGTSPPVHLNRLPSSAYRRQSPVSCAF